MFLIVFLYTVYIGVTKYNWNEVDWTRLTKSVRNTNKIACTKAYYDGMYDL